MVNLPDSKRDNVDSAMGPGQRLRAAREARQLTREAVAMQMRVEAKVIDALERDDYAQLPAAVFVRGYLRAYAKLVGLAAEPLVAAFDGRTTHTPPPLVLPTAIGPDMESRRGFAGWTIIALALLSLLLFYQWWRLEGHTVAPARVPPVAVQPAPAPVQTAPVQNSITIPTPTPAPTPVLPAEPAPTLVQVPMQVAPTPAPNPVEVPKNAGTTSAAAASAPLVLQFKDDCWVVIRDATGRALLQGMIKSGARHALTGKPPYEITLGNSPAVDIEYLGQHFDQSRYTGALRIARFTLGK